MTNVLANLARMSSSTTGTGTLTLDMAAQGCLTFAEAGVTNGQIVSYAIEDYDTAGTVINREVGAGTYSTAGPTLGRTTVYASTNSGARINCSGRQHVFVTALKEDFSAIDAAIAALSASNSVAVSIAQAALAATGYDPPGDGTDDPAVIPGPPGPAGVAGAAGAAGDPGPAFAALAYLNEPDETAILPQHSTGAQGHVLPFLDVQNKWSANQIIEKANANFRQSAISGDAAHLINATAGSAAISRYGFFNGTAAVDRWLFGKSADAESGGDAGSNFVIYYYDDAGAFKGFFLEGSRVDGSAKWYGGQYSNGVTGGSKGAGTLNFGTLYEGGVALSEKYGRRDGPWPMFFAEPGEDGMPGPPGATGATGPAGGGGGGSATTVEVNLGSAPNAYFQGKFTITDAAISATSKVLCWQAPGPYTGKGTRADEAEMQPVQVIAVEPAAGSAVVKWQTPPMVVEQPLMAMGGQPASAIVPGGKDPQAIAGGPAKRIGRVRGNVKFSYTVFA